MSDSILGHHTTVIPSFLIFSDTSDDEGESSPDDDDTISKTPKRPTRVVPNNTPGTKTENSSRETFPEQNAEDRQERLAYEMKNRCIGPMPIDKLLDASFPRCNGGEESEDEADETGSNTSRLYFCSIPTGKLHSEKELYKPLCLEFNKILKRFRLIDTHKNGETSGLGSLLPDLCLYDINVVHKVKAGRLSYLSHFGLVELVIEVKIDGSKDPFNNLKKNGNGVLFIEYVGIGSSDAALAILGQITAYAAQICARQHRVHCFTISIYGTMARIIRWDRAGAIVSEAFDYQKTKWLYEFARRLDQASEYRRGYDTTVQDATPEEEEVFVKVISEHVRKQVDPEDNGMEIDDYVEMHYEKHEVCKIPVHPSNLQQSSNSKSITDSGSTNTSIAEQSSSSSIQSTSSKYFNTQYFLVSRPVASPLSVAGRGTRGYWSVKLPDKDIGEQHYQIAFLKDTWRVAVDDMEKEGDIMVELVEAGVSYISDIFCHGDVLFVHNEENNTHTASQDTLTDKYKDESWNCNKDITPEYSIAAHRHYRMASIEVGFTLKSLLGTKELIHATRNAFKASLDSLRKCKRLHRDIGVENIILVRKDGVFRMGILIDWELSCPVNRKGNSRRYARSAQWAFMSIDSLNPRKARFRHSFQDDVESFFYVILYAGLLWLPYTTDRSLATCLSEFFGDHSPKDRGKESGGSKKLQNFVKCDFLEQFVWKCKTFGKWLTKFNELCRQKHVGISNPQWTPEMLYDFWKQVDRSKLPTSDRFEHEIIVDNRAVKNKPVPATRSESARRYKQLMEHTQNMTIDSSSRIAEVSSSGSRKRTAIPDDDADKSTVARARDTNTQREKRRRAEPEANSGSELNQNPAN